MDTSDRHTYDAATLSTLLHQFEERYSMSSADFHRMHVADDDALQGMPGSVRQAWAGFYAEWQRMAPESSFADQAARELATA
jgi:hypothetical protein